MNDQQFEMMMQMHRDTHDKIDGVKDAVQAGLGKLDEHIKEDDKVHDVVKRHTTYWKLVSGGLTGVTGWLGLTK